MKKIWEKPNLVVLTRNRPEESVLTHCKLGNTPIGGGPEGHVNGCHDGSCSTNCDDYNSWTCSSTCSGPEAS
jgi:hypothetical protein